MGLVLAPALLLAAPAAADTSFEGPDPAAMSSPEMVAANAVAIAVAAVQQAELQSPEAVAERAESADAYAGLSGSEASDLAAETFAPLGEPTWQPPEMPDGMEIVSYEGKTSMLVAPEGSIDPSDPPETVPVGTDLSNFSTDGRVIESTMPIRAREGAEGLQPVDPTLIDSGDHVEPTNAAVEAEIPDDLADGIDLPELEISLLPEGADDASDAELIGTDKLFYAGVATDTDFLATPTPIGVETFLQLRSADSPETHSVEVGLPAGGSIHGTADGTGAVIEDSDGPVASVLPPTAFDADGTPVAVEMSTQGSSIVLEVDHQAGDYHYPILVDPVTQAYNWSSSGATCPGAGSTGNVGWWFETTQPTKFAAAACAQTFGLVNMNVANETFAANDYSQWIWKPPAYTTIQGVTFSNTIHSAVSSCANFGLYNQATSSWQSSNINESNRCSSWSNVNKSYSTTAAAEQNLAVMGLSFPTAGPRASAWDSSSAVTLTLNDFHNPWLSSVSPTQSGNWVDDTEGSTTRTYNPTMTFDDKGLGVTSLWFISPLPNDPTTNGISTYSRSCSGSVGSGSCTSPTSWSNNQVGYKLPEGESTIAVIPYDAVGRGAYETWVQRVDRSAPVISSIEGEPVSNGANLASGGLYELSIEAMDGSASPASARRSGVQSVAIYLDGSQTAIDEITYECALAGGGCPAEVADTLELDLGGVSAGTHTYMVKATDALGHSTSEVHLITVHDDHSDPQVSLSVTALDANGNYTITVQAQDGSAIGGTGSYGSGIVALEIYANNTQVEDFEQECFAGGCTITRQIAAHSDSADPEVTAIVYDEAGNGSTATSGTPRQKFQYFGYNENFRYDPLGTTQWLATSVPTALPDYTRFPQQMIDMVRLGGGNVLRVDFDWCEIVGTKGENSDPDQWNWGNWDDIGSVEGFFFAIRYLNLSRAPSEPELTVLPTFWGSPHWARPTQRLITGGFPDPTNNFGCRGFDPNTAPGIPMEPAGQDVSPPQESHLDDWSEFVTEFLKRYGPNFNSQHPVSSGPLNGIHAVEVWNEPNKTDFWGVYDASLQNVLPEPERFARLVTATYEGVTAAGVQNQIDVLPGGLAPAKKRSRDAADFTNKMLKELVRTGDEESAEAFSIHVYADEKVKDRNAVDEVIRKYKDVVSATTTSLLDPYFGDHDRWITEIGFPSGVVSGTTPAETSTTTQRARMRQAVTRISGLPRPPTAFIVHQIYDDFPPVGSSNEPKDEQLGYGVWQNYTSAQPKEVYCQLKRRIAIPGVPSYPGICP